MPTHDSINRRLERVEQVAGNSSDHGPSFTIIYTSNWHGGDSLDPYELEIGDESWDTYEHATAVAREDPVAIEAAIAAIRAEAIAHRAPRKWILSVRMADDGSGDVLCAGAPWWSETKVRTGEWDPAGWRRYPGRSRVREREA
jgi:hypothetical protein